MFCFSGIILNHRNVFSGVDVSRSMLPASYRYDNWNNGSVKGSIHLSSDTVLLYGGAGIWLTDTLHTSFSDYNAGLKKGVDNRITNKIIKTGNNEIYAATTFDLYKLTSGSIWENLTEKAGIDERISDLVVKGDSLVVLTRSYAYVSTVPFERFTRMEFAKPNGYSPDVPLFRTFWLLHSGELFGLPGQLFVDCLGILLIVLCVTGIIFFFCPGIIKRKKKKHIPAKTTVNTMKASVRWHNKIGVTFLVFFLLLAISGMFLRPPLMIAIIRSQVKPVPGSILSDDNPWHDKLRCLRYDSTNNDWILYSSSGFYRMNDLASLPEKMQKTPPVSVMGVTVLEPDSTGWMVGSFSGLYHWDRNSGEVMDCYTGKPVAGWPSSGRPVFNHTVSGYSEDFHGKKIVFEYSEGAHALGADKAFASMPETIQKGRMSLWHACLEIHVGRAYRPFIGPFSDLFVFLSGIFLSFILISGYIVYRKRYKKKA